MARVFAGGVDEIEFQEWVAKEAPSIKQHDAAVALAAYGSENLNVKDDRSDSSEVRENAIPILVI